MGAKNIVSHDVMLSSLANLVNGLIDLSVDVPAVYGFAVSPSSYDPFNSTLVALLTGARSFCRLLY